MVVGLPFMLLYVKNVWVKFKGDWIISEWWNDEWWSTQVDEVEDDSDFDEIDERRIHEPE